MFINYCLTFRDCDHCCYNLLLMCIVFRRHHRCWFDCWSRRSLSRSDHYCRLRRRSRYFETSVVSTVQVFLIFLNYVIVFYYISTTFTVNRLFYS